MKLILIILLTITTRIAIANEPCNQQVYDQVYRTILESALNSGYTVETMEVRNTAIINLRALCNGQISTWEKKSKEWEKTLHGPRE